MKKINELVEIAKREIIEEDEKAIIEEIKIRLREIVQAERTIKLFRASYEERLISLGTKLEEVKRLVLTSSDTDE